MEEDKKKTPSSKNNVSFVIYQLSDKWLMTKRRPGVNQTYIVFTGRSLLLLLLFFHLMATVNWLTILPLFGCALNAEISPQARCKNKSIPFGKCQRYSITSGYYNDLLMMYKLKNNIVRVDVMEQPPRFFALAYRASDACIYQ
jgi:hypothetical protein